MRFYLFVFFLLFQSLTVFAATRADQINDLFNNYRKRFSSGSYVANSQLAREFTLKQEALADTFKKTLALKPLLTITNDFDANLSVQLYIMINDDNTMMGFFYEKSSYADEEERSFLRFKLLSDLEKGLGFVSVRGIYALNVKGFYFKPATSGTLQFIYLTNLKNKTTAAINLFVIFKNGSWDLYNESYQAVRSAEVKTWSSFLPPNGGVKQIILN